MTKKDEGTIHRASHPRCPACQESRLHTAEEWAKFHPEAGKGINEH